MLQCLSAPPSAPPLNALRSNPRIASLIGLYSQAKDMGALPNPGGLLDQRADHYAFFAVFSAAIAEHEYNKG